MADGQQSPDFSDLRVRTVQQAKADLPKPEYMAPAEDLTQGTKIRKAYDAASQWLGEHEQHLSEKILRPFREGLDNMADEIESSPYVKAATPVAKGVATGTAELLRMVPVGKDVQSTALAMLPPPELKGLRVRPAANILHEEGDAFNRVLLKSGEKEVGRVNYNLDKDAASITASHVDPEFRGAGHGTNLYTRAFDEAKKRGAKTITSDLKGQTSMDAAKVWDRLKEKGYAVEKVPSKVGSPGYKLDLTKPMPHEASELFESKGGEEPEIERLRRTGVGTKETPPPTKEEIEGAEQRKERKEAEERLAKQKGLPGSSQNEQTHDKLISHINKKSWWHVPPEKGEEAYAHRGQFFSESYDRAEFYGRPLDDPQHPKIKNPLVGSEDAIEKELGISKGSETQKYKDIIKRDRAWALAARRKGYDSIALMSPKGWEEYQKTGKIPRSIELNTLEKLKSDSELKVDKAKQGLAKPIKYSQEKEPENRSRIVIEGIDVPKTNPEGRYSDKIKIDPFDKNYVPPVKRKPTIKT